MAVMDTVYDLFSISELSWSQCGTLTGSEFVKHRGLSGL